MYNCKNYKTDGGDKLVIGGTLEIKEGASVTGVTTATLQNDLLATTTGKALDAKQGKVLDDKITAIALKDADIATVQADSTATELAGLVTDFNALLAKLKTAGLMANE